MVKTKPFVIDYKQPRVLIGCEFVDSKGEIFKSPKALKEAAYNNGVQYNINPIIFCHACGAGNRHNVWGFPNTPNARSYKQHKGQCPNCGERLTLEYGCEIAGAKASDENGEIKVAQVRGKSPTGFPSALKWWPVDDGKLAIESVVDLYFSRTMHGQYWLKHEALRYRYIFNLETGLSYSMRGVDAKGNASEYSGQTNRLQNRTFGTMQLHYDMYRDFVDVVLGALKEQKGLEYTKKLEKQRYGNEMETVYSCGNHKVSYNMLGWVNYFAVMKPVDLGDMLEMTNRDVSDGVKKYFKNLIALSSNGEVEWLPKYMQKRSIRRRLKKRAVSFYLYKWLYACGIRDINVMNSIIDDYIDVQKKEIDTSDSAIRIGFNTAIQGTVGEIVARHCVGSEQKTANFMKWALKGRSAASTHQFVTSVLASDSFMLDDSVRMYEGIPKNHLPSNNGNLKELHDALVVVDRKLRFANKEIELTETEKSLEMDKNGYSFKLAKDTDTLYDIGKAMGICVGSYGHDAVAKRCTIMTMSKDDRYVACIELRVNKKAVQMVQLKSRFNHTVKEIAPIVEWVAATGINAECNDYHNAINQQTNGFDNSEHDYHVENPRLNVPIERRDNNANGFDFAFEDDDLGFLF